MPSTHRDFTGDLRAARGENVTFTVNGEQYDAIPDAPAGLFLDFSAVADGTPKEQVQVFLGFFDAVLLPDSRERFAKNMRNGENPITMPILNEVASWLMEVYSGRPPEQSRSSSRKR